MPGFLADVVLPPGNPAMDVIWKRQRSDWRRGGDGRQACRLSKIGDAVTDTAEAGRQLHIPRGRR